MEEGGESRTRTEETPPTPPVDDAALVSVRHSRAVRPCAGYTAAEEAAAGTSSPTGGNSWGEGVMRGAEAHVSGVAGVLEWGVPDTSGPYESLETGLLWNVR